MHDFSCPDPDDMLDKDFAKVSKYYKENQEGVEAMCKIMEDMVNETARETARETAMEIAKNLIEEGMSYEQIAKVTGLPLEEVQKLAGDGIA
jgi:predicted transposase/invertase (TIGR01784 family)